MTEWHVHTTTPALNAPWCEVCNVLLTWAIVLDEACDKERECDDGGDSPHPGADLDAPL